MTYRVGVDTGGTFTDIVALDEDGRVTIHKVPSDASSPATVMLAGLTGAAERLGHGIDAFLASCDVIVIGSTVALNTLIQLRGAETLLLTTEGHEDSIEIRLGHKEDGHRWDFAYPAAVPLVPAQRRIPVRERVLADGTIYTPLDEADLRDKLAALADQDIEAIAISCLWAFLHPEHEQRIAELAQEYFPATYLSLSINVLPRMGEYTRTSTTVASAYIGPVLVRYMEEIEKTLASEGFSGRLYFMQSNGGVGTRSILEQRPVAALNSGPAGGPIAALHFAHLIDEQDVISIDMGGTSFDVSLVKGGLPDVVSNVDVARYRVGLPMVNVTSIGAGGGSIARVDERGMLQVGPNSAEARPGPACYGLDGTEATVTDALLVLGYLSSSGLLGGRMPLNPDKADEAVRRNVAEPLGLDVDTAAQGIIELTANNMVEGIRIASIDRGYDPRDFVLVAGGGAGPAFAGLLARKLDIRLAIVPKPAGVLCAFGEARADLRHDAVHAFRSKLSDANPGELSGVLSEMEEASREALHGTTDESRGVRVERSAEMKYIDQIHYCDVSVPAGALDDAKLQELRSNFHERHESLYTYCEPENEPEILSLRVSVIVEGREITVLGEPAGEREDRTDADRTRAVLLPGERQRRDVPVFDAERLDPGRKVPGPAIVEHETSTIAVLPEDELVVDSRGFFLLHVGESDVG